MMFTEVNTNWRLFYYRYLDKYFPPDIPTASVIVGIIFRIYLLCAFYHHRYIDLTAFDLIVFGLIHTIIGTIDMIILYHRVVNKEVFFMKLVLYPCNIFEILTIMAMSEETQQHRIYYLYTCIGAFTMMGLILMGAIVRYYSQLFPAPDPNHANIRKKAFQQEDIEHEKLILSPDNSENNMCPICWNDYSENAECYLLECGHRGHAECLNAWWEISEHKKCFYHCPKKSTFAN